ncbi:MAG TPA: hypothetical protein VFV99_10780, partial [Kofleriaceae bacterium]|nr:hypothetical protein [Kofleriaceae bacterium]
ADAPPDARMCLSRATYPLTITAGAFPASPDHPSVIVVVPQGFDPTPPLDLVVYIHGFNNCITNVVGDTNTACAPNTGIRQASSLATQLDASGRNALLVVPEVMYDQASGDPGQLGVTDGMKALLTETLASVPAPLGPLDLASHGRVIVATHSGGYQAASAMITFGGVPVDEVWLLDSLYGYTTRFDAWVMKDIASLASTRRFVDLYTSGGGTDQNSIAMASRAASWVTADPSVLIDDQSTTPITDDALAHGLVFKHVAETHNDVPRVYMERLLATSKLAPVCN